MKKFSISLVGSFVANNVVGTAVAMFILNPLLNPMFGNTVRTQEQGLNFPTLLGGSFLLTVLMIIAYPHLRLNGHWLSKGAVFGAFVGFATYTAGHMIISGWSVLPPLPMTISGMLDVLATIASGIVIAYIYRND